MELVWMVFKTEIVSVADSVLNSALRYGFLITSTHSWHLTNLPVD